MKKTVLIFGLIAGAVVSIIMLIGVAKWYETKDAPMSMWIGYASMIIAFSTIYVGIKNYRDRQNNGLITFGKAFRIGLFITLIASTVYVIAWMIYYYNFVPDFMDMYSNYVIEEARNKGTAEADISKQIAEMDKFKEMYKNPIMVILFTYAEIVPVGLLISLISALILKRNPKNENFQAISTNA